MRFAHAKWSGLTDAERQQYEEEGRRATERCKAGFRAFAPKGKKLEAQRDLNLTTTALERYADLAADEAVDLLISECASSGRSLKQTLAATYNLKKGRATQERLAEEADRKFLVEYRAQETSAVVPKLVEAIPALKNFEESFSCLAPILGAPVVERGIANAAQVAALLEASTNIMSDQHASNMSPIVRMMWDYLHRLLPDDPKMEELEAVTTDDDMQDGECLRHGMCVCCPEREDLKTMRGQVFKFVKSTFPKDEPLMRKLLVGRRIFIRFVWLADNSDDEELINDWRLEPMYWHVSRMSFSPYDLMLQPMSLASPAERRDACASDREHCLKASGSMLAARLRESNGVELWVQA